MRYENISVLLVEDNPDDADIIQETLSQKRFPQFKVIHTTRLHEASKQLALHSFDVVLLDLSLPDSFGLDTVKQAHQMTPGLPIIVLTGNEDTDTALTAVQLGAQDYLLKGWTDDALLTRTITYAIERKRAEEELRRSERRFRTVIEKNGDGIVVIDQQNMIRFVNSTGEALFGCTASQLIGQQFHLPVPLAETMEFEISHPNGTVTPVSMRIVEIDWEGQPAHLASLRDITQRKKNEKELQLYREHLENLIQERTTRLEEALIDVVKAHDNIDAIINSIADGIIVNDLNYQIIITNPAAKALFTLQIGEILGRGSGADQKFKWLYDLIHSAFTHRIRDCEIDVKLEDPKSGQLKIIQAHTSLVDNRNGELLGAVTIIRDVTQLREVDRLKTEFLTLAAHELRTPLTSILGFSELLTHRQVDNQRQQRYLATINEKANHLAEIISNLLDIARLEAGRTIEINQEPIELKPLIETVVDSFSQLSPRHVFDLELASPLPPILGDATRLKQVCKSLLSNAVKYSPQGGTITIQVKKLGEVIQVSVQDEGIGITPEHQAHLFEQFYRVDTTHTAVGGTGLGLTISKLIVNLHHGEIWLDSKPAQGTTVYFTLPLTNGHHSNLTKTLPSLS